MLKYYVIKLHNIKCLSHSERRVGGCMLVGYLTKEPSKMFPSGECSVLYDSLPRYLYLCVVYQR